MLKIEDISRIMEQIESFKGPFCACAQPMRDVTLLRRLWLSGRIPVVSLEVLVASDFDKVAGTAIYYLQYYYICHF